jgi:hypothetical protein
MRSTDQTQRATLAVQAAVNPVGEFEVMAITAGVGNGWEFGREVLQDSLPLWEGVECFVDHSWFGHSIRDLGGVVKNPTWDEVLHGIKVQLKVMGPSGPLVTELGKQILCEGDARPRVGFSADVNFQSSGRKVLKILRVNSLDLVFNPARGGAFVRALNSMGGGYAMADQNGAETPIQELRQEVLAAQETAQQAQRSAQLAEEAEAVKEARLQLCGVLLDTRLGAAKLPAAMVEHIRGQFAGRVFSSAELDQAIEGGRKLVSDLTGSLVAQGIGCIHGMFDSNDRLQAAVDDLFEVPREKGLEGMKVARLQGIRELYLMLTGDDDLHGGYYAERVRLATTADFTGLVKNALNKIVANTWEQLGRAGYDWWTRVSTQEHFTSLQSITGTLVGTVGALPVVNEGAAYTELAIGDSPETASFTKYGGYIPLTLELIDRDETRKLKAYPRELASAGLRRISSLVAAIFTANSGAGPTMADSGALFNNTATTTAGGHANLLTGALSASQWDVVSTAVYNQPMLIKNAAGVYGTGPKMAVNPRYLLVPRALQLAAMKVLYPTLENAANIYSENQQRGQPGDVVTVPEWTDATDWAAVSDPRIAPAIYVGERFGIMPEVFIASNELSPAVFTNDEHRLKVRQFVAVWVNDFRPLHKSNVTG